MRCGVQQTEFFVISGHFLPFPPLTTQKIKILKQDTIILHLCTTNDIIWCMLPDIWCMLPPGALSTRMTSVVPYSLTSATLMSAGKDETRTRGYIYIYICICISINVYTSANVCIYLYICINTIRIFWCNWKGTDCVFLSCNILPLSQTVFNIFFCFLRWTHDRLNLGPGLMDTETGCFEIRPEQDFVFYKYELWKSYE